MDLFNYSFVTIGSICLSVSALHLLIYTRRPDLRIHLLFSLMAFCSAVSSYYDLAMYTSSDTASYTSHLKATNSFQGLLWILFTWFIRDYTHDDRFRMVAIVSGLYAIAILLNLILPYGILFESIERLDWLVLPWGENIPAAVGPASVWRLLPDAAWLLLLLYSGLRCYSLLKMGEKRRALFFGISLYACIGFGYLHGTLVDLNVLPPPSLWYVTFLALVVLMSGALVNSMVAVPELRQKVAVHEDRWQKLLDNAKMLVVGLDTDGLINYANPYFSAVTGYERDELVGQPVVDFIPETQRARAKERISKAMQGQLRERSYRGLRTRDGTLRQIHWAHVMLQDTSGQVTGTLSIGEDVTELEEAHQAIADEKERMGVILGTLNTGLALMDREFNVLWVNNTLAQLFPEKELVGEICYQIAEGRTSPCEQCGAEMAFADGLVHETEGYNSTIERWVQIVSLPIKDARGQVTQVLEATTDITERKQTEAARDSYLEELRALKEQLERENVYLKQEISADHGFTEIIGKSNGLLYVLSKVQQVAGSDATVLIQGETGVGKELVARAIHSESGRARKPFVKIDCTGIPPNLVESELFGHEAGAFTGAEKLRRGRFELAEGGTVFLDEISELPIEIQAKLLRILQEKAFERVGGNRTFTADVRIIAATNRQVTDEVAAGRFRADLYYRLHVYPITVPPLRDRRDDIPLLVNHFTGLFSKRAGKRIDQVPAAVMDQFTNYHWPGNIRELRNVIERSVITSQGDTLRLPEPIGTGASTATEKGSSDPEVLRPLEDVERGHIQQVLEAKGWRIGGPKGAAVVLGLNPSTLRFRMKKLGIRKPD
jgi:PAS domain S-box-containing protein